MGKNEKDAKNSTMTSTEIEKLLLADFGDKLQPVDNAKLAKQRRQQAIYRERNK